MSSVTDHKSRSEILASEVFYVVLLIKSEAVEREVAHQISTCHVFWANKSVEKMLLADDMYPMSFMIHF